MFTDNEIKKLFYVLDAKFFHGLGNSSIFLEYRDNGYMLWFGLFTDTDPQWIAYTEPGIVHDSDRKNFCELLFHLFLDACEERPWLLDRADQA